MQNIQFILSPSSRPNKKLMILLGSKIIHFGATGYSDFTLHKDIKRKMRYENRHKKKEDWTINGIYSAGFWAKWILWNKPTLQQSIIDVNKRFHLKIKLQK